MNRIEVNNAIEANKQVINNACKTIMLLAKELAFDELSPQAQESIIKIQAYLKEV